MFIDDVTLFENIASNPPVPNAPVPLSPADGHETDTPRPVFSWIHSDTNSTAQNSYHIQFAESNLFTAIVYQETVATSDTSPRLLNRLPTQADSLLFWRVRTTNNGTDWSVFSSGDSNFNANLRVPNAPMLTSPADGHETTTRAVRLSWTHSDSDGSGQDTFAIQISTNSSFTTIFGADTVVTSNEFYDTTFPVPTGSNVTYFWRVMTSDEVGFGAFSDSRSLVQLDTTPVVKIVEVHFAPTLITADSESVDLYVVDDSNDSQGFNLSGWTIDDLEGAVEFTFPSVVVRTGTLITWSSGFGSNETNDADGRVTFYSNAPTTALVATKDEVVLKDNAGNFIDAVVYGVPTQVIDDAAVVVAAGQWGSVSDSVNILAINTEGGESARTISRDTPAVDSNSSADWRIDTTSIGSFPVHHFTVTADSANPVSGESFTLTVKAIDWRGDVVTSFRGGVGLSVSAGTITKNLITFVAGNLGVASSTVSLNGSGNVTITVATTTGFGTMGGETSVNISSLVDHFSLLPTDPNLLVSSRTVRRGQPFNLRITARDASNAVFTTYTGTVTLSVTRGTISPTSVTFDTAWSGDTTVRVTISGASAVGQDTITVADGSKTGDSYVIPLTDNRFAITEVLAEDLNPVERDEWVEIYNRSLNAVDLGNFHLTDGDGGAAGFAENLPSVSVPSGKYVIVHIAGPGTNDLDFTDTDGAAHVYILSTADDRLSTIDPALLYASTTTFDSSTIASFVGWGGNVAADDDDAAGAGLWNDGNFITFTGNIDGRSVYRAVEGADNFNDERDWIAASATDTYSFTEGFATAQFDGNLTGVTITLTSGSGSNDTVALGETIIVRLTATGGGNASQIGVTTVFVTSGADTAGIVVTLVETANGSRDYRQVVEVSQQSETPSHDGMRRIGATLNDSVSVTWVKGGASAITAVPGPLDHFDLSAPTFISSGTPFQLSVTARTALATKTDYMGTANLTVSAGSISPTSFTMSASDLGETSFSVTITGGPGQVTITVTESITGETGVTTVSISDTLTLIFINELLQKPATVDFDGNGIPGENGIPTGDEWIELYNDSTGAISIGNWQLLRDGDPDTFFVPAGTIIPAKGYFLIYHDSLTSFGLVDPVPQTIRLFNNLGQEINFLTYTVTNADQSTGRSPDGADSLTTFHAQPGHFLLSSDSASAAVGDSFVIDAQAIYRTLRAGDSTLMATSGAYSGVANVSVSAGTIIPTTTSAFSVGLLSEAFSITGACGDVTITFQTAERAHTPGFSNGKALGTMTISIGGGLDSDSSAVTVIGGRLADGIETATIQVFVVGCGGDSTLAGVTVTPTSSKGGADTITPASAITDANGIATFTVVTKNATPSVITVVANGVTLDDSPTIAWVDAGESGVTVALDTPANQREFTNVSAGAFILHPVWRGDGKAIAYLARTGPADTWNVYAAYDDGTNGDTTADDNIFKSVQVTGAQHSTFHSSRPAWDDVLDDVTGARKAIGAGNDNEDIVFSAWYDNWKYLFAVRANGVDAGLDQAHTVALVDTNGGGNWVMPSAVPGEDTIYSLVGFSVYRINGRGTTLWKTNVMDPILTGLAGNFKINGKNHVPIDLSVYDRDVMAVSLVWSAGGGLNFTRSEIVILNNVDTAGLREWTAPDGTNAILVNRNDSSVAWTLSWDTGGTALSWTRDANNIFNWQTAWNATTATHTAYSGANFNVEAVYVNGAQQTPNKPASLLANSGTINDLGMSFSRGSTARVAFIRYDPGANTTGLYTASIDGQTRADQNGGILFENGRVTAIIDENDLLSGSVNLSVSLPGAPPANTTPESIALTGNAREYFPDGQTFDDSITVILYYNATDLLNAGGLVDGTSDEFKLKVFWYNTTTAQWEDMSAVVDPTNRNGALGSLTFQTSHFSIYGIGVFVEPTIDTSSAFLKFLQKVGAHQIPAGETVGIVLHTLDENGDLATWPSGATILIDSFPYTGPIDFVDTATRRITARFDTPGWTTIAVVDGDSTATQKLLVISNPFKTGITSPADTYLLIAGRLGIGRRALKSDTQVTAILRSDRLDTDLRLTIRYDNDTVIVNALAPTYTDSPLVFWENLSVVLNSPGSLSAEISNSDTILVSIGSNLILSPSGVFREDTDAPVAVEIPDGASDTPVWITMNRNVSDALVATANNALAASGRNLVEGSIISIEAEDIDGGGVASFNGDIRLRFPAARANGLKIAFLDNNRWVEIDKTDFDDANGVAVASSNHLSVWGLTVGLAGTGNVQSVRLYPNPWRSDGPTGGLAASNPAWGIKFDQMPGGNVRVRIHTLAGELVLDGTIDPTTLGATAANGHLQVVDVGGATGQVTRWDLKNQSGKDVASGIYLVLLEGPGGRAIYKLAVIR